MNKIRVAQSIIGKLYRKRTLLLIENKDHLRMGEYKQYQEKCLRVMRIASLIHQKEREVAQLGAGIDT